MKTKPTRRNPFDHAADLPAAYEELSAALKECDAIGALNPVNLDVCEIAECMVWQRADALARAAARVAAAARRVKVAKVGKGRARRWDGFTGRRAA